MIHKGCFRPPRDPSDNLPPAQVKTTLFYPRGVDTQIIWRRIITVAYVQISIWKLVPYEMTWELRFWRFFCLQFSWRFQSSSRHEWNISPTNFPKRFLVIHVMDFLWIVVSPFYISFSIFSNLLCCLSTFWRSRENGLKIRNEWIRNYQMFFRYGEDWIFLKSSIIKSNKTKQKKRERNGHARISLWNCHWSWLAAAKLMAARNNDWLQQTVFVSIALRLWRRSLYYPFQPRWNKRCITRSENI